MRKILFILLSCATYLAVQAQETFPVNGAVDKRPRRFAFINATIIVNAEQVITNGVLLVNGERIESVGQAMPTPEGYTVFDLKGKYIYPSFVDPFTSYGVCDAVPKTNRDIKSVYLSTKKGLYAWNEAIRPEVSAYTLFSSDSKKAEEFRKLGFGVVNTIVRDGIVRGTSAVVSLNSTKEDKLILKEKASRNLSFEKGSSKNDYPSSLMGAIALLRQTYYDAEWYRNQKNTAYNISLATFNEQQNLPQIFEVDDVLNILRADKIGDEFGQQYIFKTVGDEYKRIQQVQATKAVLILPVNFPKPYQIESLSDAKNVSLARMKEWELAPSNPALVEQAAIPFAFTTADLENKTDFLGNVRLAIEKGLTEKQALKSLTEIPAQFLGVDDEVGSIAQGKLANFIITSTNVFKKDNVLYENWIQGNRYVINDHDEFDFRGNYNLQIVGVDSLLKGVSNAQLQLGDTLTLSLKIGGTLAKYDLRAQMQIEGEEDTASVKGDINRSEDLVNFYFDLGKNPIGNIRFSGYVASYNPVILKGNVIYPDGSHGKWQATLVSAYSEEAKKTDHVEKQTLAKVIYPFVAYGWEQEPTQETILFKNATIWTNEKDGKLYETDLLIENGKIKTIGKGLTVPQGARVLDVKGKHITPGIIDEHSHIAISGGVNEAAQAVTSEVSIAAVVNSEDINIYRQLAGGVTVAHLLHGSANPIGGQTSLIKLRWGKSPEDLKYGDNPPFIKFALGENVKQSNWGENHTSRFPQTRMGVEQVYVDAFTRAKEYKLAWEAYKTPNKKNKKALVIEKPRKDLELDALVEILDKKRHITCHSYMQSEINMLMHLADSMKFDINTFTHVLEGYKIADKMKQRNIAGSTFADWWAYKMEVAEAIPYNATLMTKVGVNTAINSDDPEMARRLNQEAAKTVKYGQLNEQDALKLITLNPAKMLHIDNRVGSIKVGKDADIVVWDNNPLSVYAKVEKTYVDGVPYFDAEKDIRSRKEIEAEKARLVQKMIQAKAKGAQTQISTIEKVSPYHCGDNY